MLELEEKVRKKSRERSRQLKESKEPLTHVQQDNERGSRDEENKAEETEGEKE